jgi:hypothetical protein
LSAQRFEFRFFEKKNPLRSPRSCNGFGWKHRRTNNLTLCGTGTVKGSTLFEDFQLGPRNAYGRRAGIYGSGYFDECFSGTTRLFKAFVIYQGVLQGVFIF